MSIEGMRQSWAELEEGVRNFRESSAEYLVEGRTFDNFSDQPILALDRALASSEELRRQGDAALRSGSSYEQVSTLILAAAAIDAMLARDSAALDPDVDLDLVRAWFEEQGGRFEDLEEDISPATVFEEGGELLAEVRQRFDEALPPMAGLSPSANRTALVSETEAVVKGLVDLAAPPATELARGFVKVAIGGAGELLSAAIHAEVATELERSAEKLGKHSPRFLREHVVKIATLRSDDRIVDEMAKKLEEDFDDEVEEAGVIGSLLNLVSARSAATAHANVRIYGAMAVTQEQGEALLADLTSLQGKYSEQMHWVRKSALWLRRGARFLAHLGALAIGPLSYAIGAGVFFVGLGYVGYSLTDRIDARNLGFADRVDGVVRLVDRHIPA